MTAGERLAEVFDRGFRVGFDTLTLVERELYRIQEFIIEYEIGGLPAYFFNRLSDAGHVQRAVEAMRRHGLQELADLLDRAAGLFASYVEPEPPETWDETLRRYDPTRQLREIDERIWSLKNYGLSEALID